jgi:DNA-binding transcriptional regulator LsrR (DeoR family)
VIGIALAARKAVIARAVLNRGIVDVLIIDRDLAEILVSDHAEDQEPREGM